MADNVIKNSRVYNKGDVREALASEKESKLWKDESTLEKEAQERAALHIQSVASSKDTKKMQEENEKLKIRVKELTEELKSVKEKMKQPASADGSK